MIWRCHACIGDFHMPGAEFYRCHASRCRVLAERHAQHAWSVKLVRLAEAYEAQAVEVEVCLNGGACGRMDEDHGSRQAK